MIALLSESKPENLVDSDAVIWEGTPHQATSGARYSHVLLWT